MSIKEYNFTEFTDKDMFEMRLAGEIPNFGYIPDSKRKEFFDFCIKNNFIEMFSMTTSKEATVYNVLVTFRFDTMFGYGPKPVIFAEKISSAIVYNDFRMLNTIPK